MERKDTLGFWIKTLDNLFFRNVVAYEISQEGVDEVTVMHENQERLVFQKEIEAEFSIAKSTVTCIVKLMEKKGYIRRESVESDGRLKKLALTELGRKIHEQHISHVEVLEAQCKRNITPEEIQSFLVVAEKLKRNLEEDLASYYPKQRLMKKGNCRKEDSKW